MSTVPLTVSTTADGGLVTNFGCESPSAPWSFQMLPEPELTTELTRFANPKTFSTLGVRVDSVWFQPAQGEEERSQDRIYAGVCEGAGKSWSMLGIFDGHAGHECADHTVKHFPIHLEQALSSGNPVDLTSVISDAFISFDNAITDQILTIFPDPEALASIPPEDLNATINDQELGGANYEKIVLAMRGTTALTVLIDEDRKNMWAAGVGDCRAILGVKMDDGRWEARDLIAPHNGYNETELQKVRDAHPGEPDVTRKNRVLGAIAVTRAFGDTEFKIPAAYTSQIFLRAKPGFRVSSSVEDFIKLNHTPPYMSAIPDVVHVDLGSSVSNGMPQFIILTSDGAMDEHNLHLVGHTETQLFQKWVEIVGRKIDAKGDSGEIPGNLALDTLRAAFGGSNEELLSVYLTLKMESKWTDDTSIQVAVF